MQWEELYKARNSSEKMDAHLTPKKKKNRERKLKLIVRGLSLTFNEQPILGLA